MIRTSVLLFLLAPLAYAQGVIHKCVDADGNVAYQDSPCPENAAETVGSPEQDEQAQAAEPPEDAEREEVVSYVPVTSKRSIEEVEACKEPHRDEIDAIEAEMLRGYSAEQGELFKQELRMLTEAMRACE